MDSTPIWEREHKEEEAAKAVLRGAADLGDNSTTDPDVETTTTNDENANNDTPPVVPSLNSSMNNFLNA